MDLAIVGIGCRLPGGASDPGAFWQLLERGVDAITEPPADRFDVDAVFDPDPSRPGHIYSRSGGFVADVDRFDAAFFGIAPREARRMDPQHRLLLEVTWEALEDGGQVPDRLAGSSTGVFIGISTHDYSDLHMQPGQRDLLDAHVNIGNALCAAPNRISYLLDLHGPSMAIETACSSSLTAVHLARRSITAGDCDLAIVGGVNLVLAPDLTIGFCKASMISPDGRCHAFDARANGYVRSEGAGVVVLKPVERARTEGDRIYAVIRSTAINEDGRTTGISLPNPDAQARLLERALAEADIDPATITYVEAHGTGTEVGDPAEAEALGRVIGRTRAPGDELIVGSAKTNVGHLEAGAGVTGLIKSALMLRERRIPPSLHLERPNPRIPFAELGLRVPTEPEAWPEGDHPARVGVSASGFGGANAHIVLEAAPPQEPPEDAVARRDVPHVLTISARSDDALTAATERMRDRLRSAAADELADICHTAAVRRSHHGHRLAVVGHDRAELLGDLEAAADDPSAAGVARGSHTPGRPPSLVFAFAGMGPQWWAMGRRLLATEPVFLDSLERSDAALRPLSGWSLLDELRADEPASRISETRVVQVVNCAFQIALADLWASWGVAPDAVIGHSAGEMAAAHVAGVLDRRDALAVSYHRGRLLHRASGRGRMLAAGVGEERASELVARFPQRLAIAAVNSPEAVTLSGETDVLAEVAHELERDGRFVRFLPTDVPYHSPLVADAEQELLTSLGDLDPRPATTPMVSTVTGRWVDGDLDAGYWWRNIRQGVRFAAGVDTLVEAGHRLVCEIGPHPALRSYLLESFASRGQDAEVVASLRRDEDECRTIRAALARLHVRGRAVDWAAVERRGRCTTLPTYPWQRQRFWLDAPARSALAAGPDTGHPLLGHRRPSPRPSFDTHLDDPRLGFLDEHVVEDTAVFPGAGYVDLALAAVRRLGTEDRGPDEPVTLADVAFHRLLFLEPGRAHQLHLEVDGDRLTVHGAPSDAPTRWTTHATARLGGPPGTAERLDLDALRRRCTRRVTGEDHGDLLARFGFHYGPAFRGLRWADANDDEAVARIEVPEGTDLRAGPHEVHPALLDAAFQALVLAADPDRQPSGPLFPVAIRQVTLRRSPGSAFWAHVVVRTATSDVLEGDVVLVDDDGEVALTCAGFRLEVLDDGPGAGDPADRWLYRLGWEPVPPRQDPPGGPARVRGLLEARPALASLPSPGDDPAATDYLDTVAPTLDAIAADYVREALTELGWSPDDPGAELAEEVASRLGVVPERRRLLAAILPLARTQARGAATAPDGRLDELAARLPAFATETQLLRTGGSALRSILTGEADPREVLLDEAGLELLAAMYHDSPTCVGYHDTIGSVVGAVSEGDAPPRVLEVGAGTAAASAAVLGCLPSGADYLLTDVSPAFSTAAVQRLQDDRVRAGTLDIERDPREQGLDAHAFDVVVAANVLHATADLRVALANCRRLLAPGGLLVLLELARHSPWLDLVFGLLDGWWRFTDHELRTTSPLLEPAAWQRLLTTEGFRGPCILEPRDAAPSLQTVVAAHAPALDASHDVVRVSPSSREDGVADQRPWLVLAGGPLRDRLTERLATRGRRCLDAPLDATTPTDGWTAVLGASAAAERPVGVVLVAGDDERLDASSDADDLMAAQRNGTHRALALAQALDRIDGERPPVWLVTCGAQTVVDGDGRRPPVHAPLWGFGRVMQNERVADRCQLIDLSADPDDTELDTLVATLLAAPADDAEDELAIRGGRRFVRRLRRAPVRELVVRDELEPLDPATPFRLETDAPGELGRLCLRRSPPRPLGGDEVAIRVHASSLNFRDVLQALGMFPAAALGALPDPRVLGIECAGTITACGADVADLGVGDEVVALAWGAHASQVVARAEHVVRKPPDLSFEQAASIVTASVTAEHALHDVARVAPGERVLIHAAAGGVGLAAIQACRRHGAVPFATAGSERKRAVVRDLGVEHVLDSRSLDFADAIRTATDGEGVDVVLNSLSGAAAEASLELLRPYGRFVELGKRDIYDDRRLGLLPFQRNLTYTAVDLIQLALDRPVEARALMAAAIERVATGVEDPPPLTTFRLGDADDAFRFMAQARHIGKVVLQVGSERHAVRPQRDRTTIHADGTYLVSGGLGGFGLATARWLAGRGARHLVLLSRSGIPRGPASDLDALRELAEVRVERVDVADTAALAAVLDRVRAELPPLRGIVHTAMVLDDDTLGQLDADRVDAVLAPKLAGAWNLHRLTAEDPVELFLLYSSMASVFGHPVQANYAAANAFLDGLAAHRRRLGRPGLAVGWGAMDRVGYVARNAEVARYVLRGGLEGMQPAQAWHTLDTVLEHDEPHLIAARIDWSALADTNPVMAASSRLRTLVREASSPAEGTDPAGTREHLRHLPPSERPAALAAYVVDLAARVLGSPSGTLDPDRPLIDHGFDSLMAVELTSAIRSDLQVRLPVVKVLQGATAREFAALVDDQLTAGDTVPEAAAAGPAEEPSEEPAEPSTDAPTQGPAAVPAHPLSAEQRRFWFLEQLDPGNPTAHPPAAARLRGPLDVPALQAALHDVVQRHEVLRSRVTVQDDDPVQIAAAELDVDLPVVDLTDRSADGVDRELQQLATEEIRRPFDLARGPLLRARLFRLTAQEHVLLLVIHHLATDAWSLNVLLRELATCYEARRDGRGPDLDPVPGTYRDHVRRQRARLAEVGDAQLRYWRRQLRGLEPKVALPGDDAAPAAPHARGGHVPFRLSRALTRDLEALGRGDGATLFMTLMSGFQVLLHRWSGAVDLPVATAVSTRDDPDIQTVVGCCINTVVVRGDLGGSPTFRQLLGRLRTTTLEALEHQDVPFDEVVAAVRPPRGSGHQPLFDTMLVLHTARQPTVRLADLTLEPYTVESGASIAELSLLLAAGDEVAGAIEYNAERFERATIERFGRQLEQLLTAAVAAPDTPIDALAIEDAAPPAITVANGTLDDLGAPARLHDLVLAQAERRPRATAVTDGHTTVRYAELLDRAEVLADRLRRAGVGPGVVTAVHLERCVAAVVAPLAVLLAGGVYLPLDPRQPTARSEDIAADADARVVVTTERGHHSGAGSPQRPAVVVDGATGEPVDRGATTDPPTTHADTAPAGAAVDDLAYVIPTSGSTGRPKLVAVTHRSIVNQLRARQQLAPLGPPDAVLVHTPPSFDPSVWELFGPLAAGARLVLPRSGRPDDPGELVDHVIEEGVTALQVVPSSLQVLLAHGGLDRAQRLRHLFCGGEPLTARLRRRFLDALDADLHHLYGPAEATIDTTVWTCGPDDDDRVTPIGRPIANVRVAVADTAGRAVPIGTVGELWIGGAGVAAGYLGAVTTDATGFVTDPADPASRWYRTGDLVRQREDGVLEFVGRRDDQVKIRGVRTEPGEVEAVLASHPTVEAAAVVTAPADDGMPSLVAFVAARDDVPDLDDQLHDLLRTRLPETAIPALIRPVDRLPVLSSGKLDRRALRREAGSILPAPRDPVPPRDETERALLETWRRLFDDASIGVDDDFFALGGHSLLAVRLVTRIERDLGERIEVSDLLERRTIAAVAAHLRSPDADRRLRGPVTVLRDGRAGPPLYLLPGVEGSAWAYVELADALDGDHPVVALMTDGSEGDLPHGDLTELARTAAAVISGRGTHGAVHLAGWSMGAVTALAVARQLVGRGVAIAPLVLLDPPPLSPGFGSAPHAQVPQLVELVNATGDLAGGEVERLRPRLTTLVRNLQAMHDHQPEPVDAPAVLFVARDGRGAIDEVTASWEEYCHGGVEVVEVPGDHHTMLQAPHVADLAAELDRHLTGRPAMRRATPR
jgi:amino acid adenylation domain-containing protein